MVATRYPSIADESTTIDFLMAGLKGQPTLTPILAHVMSNKPTTIRDFTRNFKALNSLYQPTLAPSPTPATSLRITGDYGLPPPPARYNQQRHQFPKQYQPARIPFHKLCKYHKALGVRCNHTDDQCQDPGHPKFRNFKPEANYMYNQHTNHIPQPFPKTHPFHNDCAQLPSLTQAYEDNQEADPTNNGTFILDSGAHPTHVTTPIANMTRLPKPLLTQTATKQQTRCTHSGIMHLKTSKNRRLSTHAVANPSLHQNLLSVKDMTHRYDLVAFTSHCGYKLDTSTTPPTICGTAPWRGTHYALNAKIANTVKYTTTKAARTFVKTSRNPPTKSTARTKQNTPKSQATTRKRLPPPPPPTSQPRHTITHISSFPNSPSPRHTTTQSQLTTHNWHVRLNHADPSKLALTAHNQLIPIMPNNITNTLNITCSVCDQAKIHPAPHKPKTHHYAVGAYVSSDTCGPVKPTSKHGNNHMLLIVCAASKFVLALFIKDRKDIPKYVHAAITHILHRMKHPLPNIRSDKAKEYTSQSMKALYRKYGITHHLSTPHQPQENGIAERLNRTIMEAVRALQHTAKLDDTHWEDAARDTIINYNLMHHANTKTSPYQLWYRAQPTLKRIFTFGQLGTIPVYAPKKKLESRADPARYMYATSMAHVMTLNLRTGAYQHIRADEFHPYHKQTDPTVTTTTAFKTRTE